MAITHAVPPAANLDVLIHDVMPLHLETDELLPMTHRVFDLDADDLRAGHGLEAATATGWRYVTRSVAGQHHIVEIGPDGNADIPRLRCINAGDHVDDLVALHDDAPAPVVEHDHELSVLRSPTCQLVALWFTRSDDGRQILVPLAPAHSTVVPGIVYAAEDLTTILRSTARRMAGGSPRPVVAADDLTLVEGIGPRIAELLRGEGVTTLEALAASTHASLTAVLRRGGERFNRADPTTWPEQAALASQERWPELEDLQRRLDGGR